MGVLGLVDETGSRYVGFGPDGPQPAAGEGCFKLFVSGTLTT